ncbi:MAG: hypothetical protein NC080_07375 [Paraprevotella sp.]|nr:hypothetical protein [Paraprevotella sp.]
MGTPIGDAGYEHAAQRQADAMLEFAIEDVAIQTALALWKRNAASSISDMQQAIANRQTRLAEQIAAHARNFWPYEKDAVDDAFGLGKATAQYDALSLTWGSTSDKDQQCYKDRLDQELGYRCIGLTSCESAIWGRNKQMVRANVMAFADREAEGRMDKLNDIRFAKQYSALALGRNHLANVPTFMNLGGAARASNSQLLNGLINSGMEALGYYRRGTDSWGSRLETRWGATPYSRVNQLPSYPPIRVGTAGDVVGDDALLHKPRSTL